MGSTERQLHSRRLRAETDVIQLGRYVECGLQPLEDISNDDEGLEDVRDGVGRGKLVGGTGAQISSVSRTPPPNNSSSASSSSIHSVQSTWALLLLLQAVENVLKTASSSSSSTRRLMSYVVSASSILRMQRCLGSDSC